MKSIRLLLALLVCLVSLFTLSVTSHAYCNGDVNDDGIYSTQDALLTLQYIAGVNEPALEQEYASDINRDGYLTTEDAIEILRIAGDLSVAPTHEYSAWITTKEPTCTESGHAYCECYICAEQFEMVIHATGHNAPDQSCTSGGLCLDCFTFLEPTGHSYTDGVCTICDHSNIKPSITYKSRSITFGITPNALKGILGSPQDIITDTITEGSVNIYVYCADYANLGVFTFIDNKLTQFYTNNNSSSVAHGGTTYSLNGAETGTTSQIVGDITVTPYTDYESEYGTHVYSFLATVGESYTFESTTDFTANEKLILHLINGCRAIYSQNAVSLCPLANKSAHNHSYDMATRGYVDHYTPEGLGPAERMEAVGIEWFAYGENIAGGQRDAYQLNDAWYNSAGHREIMLKGWFTKVGIGIVYNANSTYKYYATENFYG